MPRNPVFNNGRTDAQNNGLSHDNKADNPNKHYRQGMNVFDNSYIHATTERFADVSPFMALDMVDRDKVPFRSTHKLSSFTLKSPMMDEIFKHKFYSIVPYKAILPNTWELFYVNPTKGDDIPDDAYCNFDIISTWRDFFKIIHMGGISLIEFIICTELIFSTGSLLSKLKYNFWPYLYKSKSVNFDVWFDTVFVPNVLDNLVVSRELQPGLFETVTSNPAVIDSAEPVRYVSRHTILDVLRSGDYSDITYSPDPDSDFTLLTSFTDFIDQFNVNNWVHYPVDLSRVIAYQITCVSQVTDASIDYLFNANLFRNVLFPQTEVKTFTWNTQVILYDTFSNKYFNDVWFNYSNFIDTCQKLFSYAKSLKFGDYFTQARPEPYAVGDLNIDDTDGLNAIEITRRIVYQRFLNWNNRVGPSYSDYKKELTGMDAMPDPTEPSLITHSVGTVSGFQVENTGDAQFSQENSVTTLLRDTSSKYEFNIIISEPSILLGLTSYDMKRLYTRLMDRANLKESRFDFFNHMLQYTGDQEIKACELDATRSPDIPIAYTTKDMHYKKQVSQASGGFVFALPSWAFTTEETDNDMSLHFGINPEFIRNLNGDFDRFFSSLSGYSLGTYFHFILKYDNDFSVMQRAMDVAPDIL